METKLFTKSAGQNHVRFCTGGRAEEAARATRDTLPRTYLHPKHYRFSPTAAGRWAHRIPELPSPPKPPSATAGRAQEGPRWKRSLGGRAEGVEGGGGKHNERHLASLPSCRETLTIWLPETHSLRTA
jgi:hypothetical protein